MAITFGNTGQDTSGVSTLAYNNNGDFLIVAISSNTTAVTAVTYNGVSMTQIGSTQHHVTYTRFESYWGLVAPAQGTNNIVLTGAGSNPYYAIQSVSGVDQSVPYTGLNTASGTGANPTITITTTVNNAYPFSFGQIQTGASAGANTTLAVSVTGGDFYMFRSTNPVTPTGAFIINTVTTSGEYQITGIGINPVVTNNGNFFLVLNK